MINHCKIRISLQVAFLWYHYNLYIPCARNSHCCYYKKIKIISFCVSNYYDVKFHGISLQNKLLSNYKCTNTNSNITLDIRYNIKCNLSPTVRRSILHNLLLFQKITIDDGFSIISNSIS